MQISETDLFRLVTGYDWPIAEIASQIRVDSSPFFEGDQSVINVHLLIAPGENLMLSRPHMKMLADIPTFIGIEYLYRNFLQHVVNLKFKADKWREVDRATYMDIHEDQADPYVLEAFTNLCPLTLDILHVMIYYRKHSLELDESHRLKQPIAIITKTINRASIEDKLYDNGDSWKVKCFVDAEAYKDYMDEPCK